MTVLTHPAAQSLLRLAQEAKARIAADQANLAEYTRLLADAVHNETGTHTVQGVGDFVVSENNTYDKGVMEASLLPGQVKRCLSSSLDGQVVKRLYPDAYKAAKQSNGYKVTVK